MYWQPFGGICCVNPVRAVRKRADRRPASGLGEAEKLQRSAGDPGQYRGGPQELALVVGEGRGEPGRVRGEQGFQGLAQRAEQILQKETFIRNEGLSTSAADVQTAVLFQLAAQSKNAKQKEALLRSAVTDHPGSAFMAQVEEALAALTASSTKATERFFATLVASNDNVNVRSEPDENTGTVVAKLSAGQQVEVEEKTVESYTVGEQSASWYRIQEPAGWVCGAFLKAVE
jgi:hypothetical protein